MELQAPNLFNAKDALKQFVFMLKGLSLETNVKCNTWNSKNKKSWMDL